MGVLIAVCFQTMGFHGNTENAGLLTIAAAGRSDAAAAGAVVAFTGRSAVAATFTWHAAAAAAVDDVFP